MKTVRILKRFTPVWRVAWKGLAWHNGYRICINPAIVITQARRDRSRGSQRQQTMRLRYCIMTRAVGYLKSSYEYRHFGHSRQHRSKTGHKNCSTMNSLASKNVFPLRLWINKCSWERCCSSQIDLQRQILLSERSSFDCSVEGSAGC